VPAHKWLVIAKNEYRVHTSRIRKMRPYFPFLAIVLLGVYVAFILPSFVDLFIDDLTSMLLSQAAVAMVQIILFLIFVYFTIIPITETLREEQAGQLEIVLAAPIKPADVLLGEFMGQMPFYAIFVTIVASFFTVALAPFGLDMLQITIIVMIFVVTFLSALWIGNVIAALLRTRFEKTARGRDIGRALGFVIALPLVALIYAIQFGGVFEALADPTTGGLVKTILGVLPSSWGAEVIVGFVNNPANMGAIVFETVARFGGLITFFVGALWLGVRAANRAYSLEPASFTSPKAEPDGTFYRMIRNLGGGGSFGTLLASVFKDYGRRLENLSKIAYIVGLIIMINIFVIGPRLSTSPEGFGAFIPVMINQFMFPILAVFVSGEVTLRGKENLFIYRKTPSGVESFVKAKLLQGWLMAIPVASGVTAITSIITFHNALIYALSNVAWASLITAANVSFVLGLFLLDPAFEERSGRFMLNTLIVILLSIGIFAGAILTMIAIFQRPFTSIPLTGMMYLQALQTGLYWLMGIVFLFLGKRKLSRTE